MQCGAEVDMQGINGGTPLMRAVETSQKEIILLLLGKGYVLYVICIMNISSICTPL